MASPFRGVLVSTFVVLLGGCGGPWGPLAGGRLAGTPVDAPVTDWGFARRFDLMQIEVRPSDPYSVNVNDYVVGGRLYVEAGDNGWSRWRRFLREDPNARVRLGDEVYPVRASRVRDPEEIATLLPAYYARDADDPSEECAASWTIETCDFRGLFFRLESRPVDRDDAVPSASERGRPSRAFVARAAR